MPTYNITSPDGSVYQVNAPEGKTEQDALAYVKANHEKLQALPVQPKAASRPSFGQQMAAVVQGAPNVGKDIVEDFTNGARTVGQGVSELTSKPAPTIGGRLSSLAKPVEGVGEMLGALGTGTARALVGDPIRKSGVPGSDAAANVIETAGGMLSPGAVPKAIKGATEVIPAAAQAVKEVGRIEDAERATNTAERLANVQPGAMKVHKSGFVLPPTAALKKPTTIDKLASGESGKVKLFQEASVHNEARARQLGAEALGLPPDTLLSEQVFDKVRQDAGQAYQAAKEYLPEIRTDMQFDRDVRKIGKEDMQAAELFPNIMRNPEVDKLRNDLLALRTGDTNTLMETVKSLRFKAKQNFKAQGDPDKWGLALAQSQAAGVIDDLIERQITHADRYWADRVTEIGAQEKDATKQLRLANQHMTTARARLTQTRGNVYAENSALRAEREAQQQVLTAEQHLQGIQSNKATAQERMKLARADVGKESIVQKYKDARKQIAKAHALESVTNPVTGEVSARGLARLEKNGVKLTDQLKEIADGARGFERAFQLPSHFGGVEDLSLLDFAYMGGGLASGHPTLAAMAFSRPVARKLLMSPWYQRRMFGDDLMGTMGSPEQSGLADIISQR